MEPQSRGGSILLGIIATAAFLLLTGVIPGILFMLATGYFPYDEVRRSY